MNPYTILEISPQASDEEIKKKFRVLAQRYHPDRVGGNEEKFKQVNLAYSILNDPVRKKHFDTTGQYNVNPSFREEAINNLAKLLTYFINEIDPDLENLIVCMKNDIQREKNTITTQISVCITKITKLEKFLKKIKRKKDGENILKAFVASQITSQENNINSLNRNLEVGDKMLEILEDYQYGDEEFEMLMNQTISTQEVQDQ
jgi:curved DNA-binding protein CbpA